MKNRDFNKNPRIDERRRFDEGQVSEGKIIILIQQHENRRYFDESHHLKLREESLF